MRFQLSQIKYQEFSLNTTHNLKITKISFHLVVLFTVIIF
jgi:hypothetical protein